MAVQISGNDITVPRDTTVTRNLTVGGVLTYEDVTNVDSIGIVTARAGVLVGSGITLSKDGDIFATGVTTTSSLVSTGTVAVSGANITLQDSGGATDDRISIGAGGDLHIYHDGTDSYVSNATGDLKLFSVGGSADDVTIRAQDDIQLQPDNGDNGVNIIGNGAVELYYDNSKKLETTSSGGTLYGDWLADANFLLADNDKIKLGNAADLQIYHDGSNSYLDDTGTGIIYAKGTSSTVLGVEHTGNNNVYINFKHTGHNQNYIGYEDDHFTVYTKNSGADSHSMRINVDASGLAFHGDTAAANRLNDYEEGTFSAHGHDSGGSQFSTSLTGKYTKIGNTVHLSIFFYAYGGTANKTMGYFTNLPFTGISEPHATGVICRFSGGNNQNIEHEESCYLSQGGAQIRMKGNYGTGSSKNNVLSLSYRTTA